MLWPVRLFEERYTAIRISAVSLAGVGYLTLVPEARAQTPFELGLAVAVLVLGYAGVWSPFVVVCGSAAAVGAGQLGGADDVVVPAVALAWAMFELGARRHGRQVWWGLALGVAGSLLAQYDSPRDVALRVAYRVTAGVAAPLLLGLYVRTLAELSRQAARHARRDADRVRAEERTAIARELHDLVAHHVASIVLRVAVARDVLRPDDPRVRQVLDDVHETGAGALADLRRLVTVLRDPDWAQAPSVVDPAALPVALAAAVERSRAIGLTVHADLGPGLSTLDARTALAVLRLAQEGLANVAKHAGTGSQAVLTIRLTDGVVEFSLRDRGGPTVTAGDGGHGLIGLRERVEVLGGALHAGPDGPGWRLTATIPTAAQAAA